jgi:hypothetical protein
LCLTNTTNKQILNHALTASQYVKKRYFVYIDDDKKERTN